MGDIADLAANIAELGLLHRWDMHGDEAGTSDEDDRTVEPQERPPRSSFNNKRAPTAGGRRSQCKKPDYDNDDN